MSVSDKAYEDLERRYLDLFAVYNSSRVQLEELRCEIEKLKRQLDATTKEDTD